MKQKVFEVLANGLVACILSAVVLAVLVWNGVSVLIIGRGMEEDGSWFNNHRN